MKATTLGENVQRRPACSTLTVAPVNWLDNRGIACKRFQAARGTLRSFPPTKLESLSSSVRARATATEQMI